MKENNADLPLVPTPFDFGSLLEVVAARWRWIAASSIAFFLLALAAATAALWSSYSVTVQLSRYEPPLASDSFKPEAFTTAALFGMISSPDALQRTGALLTPPLTAERLARRLTVAEDRNSELITVMATGKSAQDAAALANLFSSETVRFTQSLQKDEAVEAGRLIAQQLANSEADRAKVRQQLAAIETLRAASRQRALALRLSPGAPVAGGIGTGAVDRLGEKIQAARDELADLQSRYTDAHPLVREQKARVASLEAQLGRSSKAGGALEAGAARPAAAPGAPLEATPVIADESTGYDALTLRLSTLEAGHAELVARQRVIHLYATHPPGYLRLMHAATAANVLSRHNRLSIGVLALLGGALGAMGMIVIVLVRELLDDRLKTGADVRRVTLLPLLGTLGDLGAMSDASKTSWAFRTWTAMQGKLSVSPNHGLVCGFTSARAGEGRSTWIQLLAQCARQCGFTVLTLSSSEAGAIKSDRTLPEDPGEGPRAPQWGSTAFTAMVVANPAQLMETLTASNLSPSVNLPLPGGWVWNLDRRKQWQRALNSWRTIDNVVIFVELPPVSDPETVLLAENMPNLIWLAESHKAEAAETMEQLETLRNARCRLVGAVLNREPAAGKRRFARWFGHRSTVLFSVLGLMGNPAGVRAQLSAGSAEPGPAPAPASLAAIDSPQRAPWQQRLTLGPGDLLNLSIFGQPELSQAQVPVGPDGRISYLEAQNIMAAGLTVDEFRAALNLELGKFRNAPEAIVIPAAYRSKKYYVLGAVVKTGAFALDRPTTLIEAVAQAEGLQMEVSDHMLVARADLSESFIARGGRRLPVDMGKLFLEGDLSQNIPVEPGDYLYFPAGDRKQIYVLGEVRFPGAQAFTPQTGALDAIAVRGGFSDRAWRKRLLIVRGSLDHPQTFVVDASDVLSAKAADFQLQPRDIVYVSSRPWIKAEELLDDGATAFIQAAVITATGLHVDPIGDR